MARETRSESRLPEFKEIRPRSMSRAVASEIREAILGGRLGAGQRLIEKDLTATFGVSRTSVREALKELEAQGYISLVPHKGAFVSRPTEDEVRELYAVVAVLEGLAAGRETWTAITTTTTGSTRPSSRRPAIRGCAS